MLGQHASSYSSQSRLKYFGANHMPTAKPSSIWQLAWDAATDTTLIILTIAAIISLVLGLTVASEGSSWIEGVAIMVAVIAVVVVTAVNDYQKDRQFQALQAKQVSGRVLVFVAAAHASVNRSKPKRPRLYVTASRRSSTAAIYSSVMCFSSPPAPSYPPTVSW